MNTQKVGSGSGRFGELALDECLREHKLFHALKVWHRLKEAVPDIPIPAVSETNEGLIQFAWSLPDVYIDIEISQDGRLLWYGRDKRKGNSEGSVDFSSEIPDAIRWLKCIRQG